MAIKSSKIYLLACCGRKFEGTFFEGTFFKRTNSSKALFFHRSVAVSRRLSFINSFSFIIRE
jgi:hypothetical protein